MLPARRLLQVPSGCDAIEGLIEGLIAQSPPRIPMRRLDHSIHAARFFFAIALLVGGSLVMGHLLDRHDPILGRSNGGLTRPIPTETYTANALS